MGCNSSRENVRVGSNFFENLTKDGMIMKKKNRVVGTQSFYNSSTGELVEMQLMESDITEKDSNFHKLFLPQFIAALEEGAILNQKTALCFWILSNLTKDNLLLYTYRQIAEKKGVSYKTVADTMKQLLQTDFIRKHSSGYYMVNPNIVFKGSYQRRCRAWNIYNQLAPDQAVNSQEIQLQNIQNKISRLRKQEETLKNKIEYTKLLESKENSGETEE